jgi:5-hydroxyisourate hydrolase-like protein (transthyretin family)
MTTEFDRRMLLQAGVVVATSATSARAQHAPAKLSTHALDMYLGKQAAGMRIDFSRKEGDAWKLLKTVIADEEGRVGEELMSAEMLAVGRYELLFHVEDYYKRAGVKLTDPAFLDGARAHCHLRRESILSCAALLLAVELPELSRQLTSKPGARHAPIG